MQTPNKKLLLRYFRNQCTEQERQAVELYLSLNIEDAIVNRYIAEIAVEISQENTETLSELEQKRAWSKFQRLIQQDNSIKDTEVLSVETTDLPHKKKYARIYTVYALIAAALALFLFIGLYMIKEQLPEPAYIVLSTGNKPGVRKKVVLPDSSVLWLNARTEIRYREGFGQRHRDIELVDGEVYFDVHRNPELPFIVQARQTNTEVLGTAFVITSYKELQYTDVQVTRGKVKVKAGSKVYPGLTIGDAVHFDETSKRSEPYRFNNVRFDPILQGVFLQGVTFQELALRIQSLYGIKLSAANADIQNRRYTIQITPKDDLNSLLSNITWINHGNYKIDGKEVIMY